VPGICSVNNQARLGSFQMQEREVGEASWVRVGVC